MPTLQTARAHCEDLWERRHYFPEQAFDLIYHEALQNLRRIEAEEHTRKAEYHRRMAERYLKEFNDEVE